MHSQKGSARDPHTQLPPEIFAVYGCIFGGAFLYWLHSVDALIWFLLVLVIASWILPQPARGSESRAHDAPTDPALRLGGSHAVLAARAREADDSPGTWASWRAANAATSGRSIPILAPIEWACQWLRHAYRKFAILPVLTIAIAIWFLWSQLAAMRAELRDLRVIASLQSIDTTGSTQAGSARRDALTRVLADRNGELRRFELSGWDLDDMEFPARVDLREAILAHTRLRRADLRAARLDAAYMQHADLTLAKLAGASLHTANLQNAHLPGVDLRGADLRHCDLRAANLSAASLRSARLCYARVAGAVVTGADLHDADLTGVDMRDLEFGRHAVLSGARWVTDSTLLPSAVAQWVEKNSTTQMLDGIEWTVVNPRPDAPSVAPSVR